MLRFIICVVVLFVFPGFKQAAAQDTLHPYLYYFSPQLNAVVIERADGTDRMLLGEGLAPEGTDSAGGSWSPSGRYFAWTTSIWAGPGDVDPDIWIVSADGEERLTMFDHLGDVAQMAWSPVEDLLFIVDKHVNGAMGATYHLVDIANRNLITSFTLFNWQNDLFLSNFRWTPDGSHILLFFDASRHINGEWTVRRFRRTVSRDGTIHDKPIGDTLAFESLERISPTFSATGSVAYYATIADYLIIEHVPTAVTEVYHLPAMRYFNEVFWSNSGDYALLTRGESWSSRDTGAELWLLSENGLNQIAEQVQFNGYSPPAFWSPQDDMARFITLDGRIHIFDPHDSKTRTIDQIEDAQEAYWTKNGETLYIAPHDSEGLTYLYDVISGEATVVDATQASRNQIISSPDSRFLTLGDTNSVLAIQSLEIIPLASRESGIRTSYQWHSDSNWLIHNQMLSVSGGGNGPVASAVTNLEGSIYRTLSEGFTTATWLPDNVIPHLAGGDGQ